MRRRFLGFFSRFSAAYLAIALLVPRAHGGIYFGFIIFAAGNARLNYYYLAYFKALRASEPDARRVDAPASRGSPG